MMNAAARVLCFVIATQLIGCGGDSPTAPSSMSPPTPQPPAVPTLYTVTGTVMSVASGQSIQNASVRVADGPNAGLSSATDGSGRYTLSGLSFAGFSVGVTASGFVSSSRGVPLTAGTTITTANFSLLPEAPWTHSGSGNTVFMMPSYFARVRITGRWSGNSNSNFIVHIGGRFVVNEILRQTFTYDGVHLTNGGGTVEIVSSNNIAWSFAEQR